MNERHRINDACPQQLRVTSVALDLLFNAGNSSPLTIGIECHLRIVVLQILPQNGLFWRIPVPDVTEPLLGPTNEFAQTLLKLVEMQQVSESETIANGLRRVAGADASFGGANGVAVLLGLQQTVDHLVAVKEDVRASGDVQTFDGPRVELLQVLQLPHQGRNVHNDTVADDVLGNFGSSCRTAGDERRTSAPQ